MFFVLSKVFSFLIKPISWVFALLLFALFTRDPRKRRNRLVWVIVMMYFFSNPIPYGYVIRAWEERPVEKAQLGKYEAVIVLGGLSGYDKGLKRIIFGQGSDRLFQAYELYKQGYAKRLLMTGGSGLVLSQDMKEGTFVRDYLLGIGMNKKDLLIESESRNTRENALLTKELLDAEGIQGKFLLVTSAFHMRRAKGCFDKAGIDVDIYPTDRHGRDPGKYSLSPDIIFPNAGVLTAWNHLIREWVGYCVYKVKGYV